MTNADQHSLSGLVTSGDATGDRGPVPTVPLPPAADSVLDSTLSGRPTHSGSTSSADLQEAADHLDDVEFEFVELDRHYELQGELGQGGMGVVYWAFDRNMQIPVAIKRLKPELVANRRALARFRSEAQAVARLNHENIVRIYRLGRDAVGPFLVLELVEGESLAARLTRGKLELDEAIRMFLALAGGISLSHRHGIIHRDIKPGNILLTPEGVPKLSDFGIARRSDDSGLTSTAAAMGTLYYMAPEQHRDAHAVTEQSDLYSLAATFYHAVTGEPPQVIREQRLPEAVREFTLKALESDPTHRQHSVAEFAADLRAAQMQLVAPSETTPIDATLREGECPACHVVNPLNRKFCKGCGKPLTEPCPQCERPSPVWERFCAECGVDIPAHWLSIEQDLIEKSQRIEALCREQEYAEALALLQPIESLSLPRWQEWKDWATDTAATLRESLAEQQQQRDLLLVEAKTAFQAARYEDVVSLLEQIHSGSSMPEIEVLRKEAISRQAELVRLIEDIKAQVASKDYAGLRRNVDRVLELSPGDKRVLRLDQQLREREDRCRSQLPAELHSDVQRAIGTKTREAVRTSGMQDYEKVGVFYLGKRFDLDTRKPVTDDLLLYDAKDLTTHAVCVGMTGSGKTGLCLSLLEEAAIDGIPAICIDSTGDVGNLMLAFPNLKPADFRPWIEPSDAARAGTTLDEYASKMAKVWKEGLAAWGQPQERIARYRDAVDISIYTPASNAGLPLTVLRSFSAPNEATLRDSEAMRERVTAAASGLLALLGINADSLQSREHILISTIFDRSWREGKDIDLGMLIRLIQKPNFDKAGFMDLESFFPSKDRFGFAMTLNNLIASPGFQAWMEGESLDIQRLLYTPEGKPRLTIISIAHLSDGERMFFVTILLNEMIAWMRNQSGTSSLRAVLYMDEVFGYFPPVANPPSKTPMLTLMKQARAFGLGVVLATQNPVDIDYKGLSNAGTWFLGRLQTERDKARVLDGLEGASAAAGATFDRPRMERILAGLGNRVFLMHNVHEDEPVVFQTRWALSFLRGPVSREQIAVLMQEKKRSQPTAGPATASIKDSAAGAHPVLPPGIQETFVARRTALLGDAKLLYRPGLLASARIRFVQGSTGIDETRDVTVFLTAAGEIRATIWDDAEISTDLAIDEQAQGEEGGGFASLPSELSRAKTFTELQSALKEHLYRTQKLRLWKCVELKQVSRPDEAEGDFRARITHGVREGRDLQVEKLRAKFAPKLVGLQEQLRKALQRVEKQKTLVNQEVQSILQRINDLNAQFEAEATKIVEGISPGSLQLDKLTVLPKKMDITVTKLAVCWTPWLVDASGTAEQAW